MKEGLKGKLRDWVRSFGISKKEARKEVDLWSDKIEQLGYVVVKKDKAERGRE